MSLTATPESRSNLAVPPGGDGFDAEAGELARELDEAGFVGDAEDGALDFVSAAGHDRPRIEGWSAERPKILSAKDVPYWREQSPPLAESYPVLLLLDCCDCQLGGAAEAFRTTVARAF